LSGEALGIGRFCNQGCEDFEWWRYRYKRDNSSMSRPTSEIEMGLPNRMQLDVYYDMAVDGATQ
jgi:hypothetical protein